MSVLDPFEVFEIEIYPLPQFEGVGKQDARYEIAREGVSNAV
jgi:hypothetical protein